MEAERDTPAHARHLEAVIEEVNKKIAHDFESVDSPCMWILDRGDLYLLSRDRKTRIEKATVHAADGYLYDTANFWTKKDHSIENRCLTGCAACAALIVDDQPAKSLK